MRTPPFPRTPAAYAALAGLALLLSASAEAQKETLEWDDFEQFAIEQPDYSSDAQLHFLTEAPPRPAPRILQQLDLDVPALSDGWARMRQCHEGLDAVSRSAIVYRYKEMRDLRIESSNNIGRAWVEQQAVEMEDVGKRASICVTAEVRILDRVSDANWRMRHGPYHRRFLDSYFPLQLDLLVRYPADRVEINSISPAQQPGYRLQVSPGQVEISALFTGRLTVEIQFSQRAPPGGV